MDEVGGTGGPRLARGVLLGSEHPAIGRVAAVAEGPAAVAISRGGAAKRYAHVDPNEDATAFATGPEGTFLVLGDGHSGREAAELAVDQLVREAAPRLLAAGAAPAPEEWERAGLAFLWMAQAAILAAVTRGARDTARTTLALAVVRPDDDWLGFASIGDSHVFHVGKGEAVDLAFHPERRSFFLGHPGDTPDSLPEKCVVGSFDLADARAVALVSDGLSERGIGVELPEESVRACAARAAVGPPELRALETARGVVEEAAEAQRRQRSGDNIAAAVWFPERGHAE